MHAHILCMHAHILCMHAHILCMHAHILCMHAHILCMHAHILCMYAHIHPLYLPYCSHIPTSFLTVPILCSPPNRAFPRKSLWSFPCDPAALISPYTTIDDTHHSNNVGYKKGTRGSMYGGGMRRLSQGNRERMSVMMGHGGGSMVRTNIAHTQVSFDTLRTRAATRA